MEGKWAARYKSLNDALSGGELDGRMGAAAVGVTGRQSDRQIGSGNGAIGNGMRQLGRKATHGDGHYALWGSQISQSEEPEVGGILPEV